MTPSLYDLVDAASSSPSPPPRAAAKRERDQRAALSSRHRNKLERMSLRDTVATLERQLDEIKRDHQQRSPGRSPPPSPSMARLLNAWEDLAHSQCEQRYRAEVENAKLRKVLSDQVKVSQTLERILLKRRSCELLDDFPKGKRARACEPSPVEDPRVLDELDALLPALYEKVDAAFQNASFRNRSEPFSKVELRHEDSSTLYAEAAEFRLLPFSLETAAEALWEYFVFYPHQYSLGPESDNDASRHSTAKDVHVGLKLEHFTGEMHIKCVARRYVEPNRVVFVLAALTDSTDLSGAPLHGACQRHTGWYVVQRSPLSPKLTEFLSAHVSAPEFYGNASDHQKRRLGGLANYLTASLASMMESAAQAIDNRLMERACATKALTR